MNRFFTSFRVMTILLLGLSFSTSFNGLATEQTLEVPSVYQIAAEPSARISFNNYAGGLGIGVCWWHSRLQRAFWNFSKFEPSLPRPSDKETAHLIRELIKEKSVVTFPGYASVYEFTKLNEKLIKKELNRWQKRDAFLGFSWAKAVTKRGHLKASKLQTHFDDIYAAFKEAYASNKILWVMLKSPFVAHSSLLYSMTPTDNGGYDLVMIDSFYSALDFPESVINDPQSVFAGFITYHYQPGDETITPSNPRTYVGKYHWVPYLGYEQ